MRRAIFFWIFISVFTWGVALAADTPPIKVGFVFVSPIGDAGWATLDGHMPTIRED